MRPRYWIAVGVVVVAVVAAGSAFAATKLVSPSAGSQAVLKDAAGRLHVTPSALSSALKKALDDQVDAAVAAGRLTKAQGAAIKARINAGPVPLGPFGGFGGYAFRLGVVRPGSFPVPAFRLGFGRFGHEQPGLFAPGMFGAGIRAVTSYLGVSAAKLRSELAAGKSLAQIAKAHGKTADGLVAVVVATVKSRLDHAVTGKYLTAAQEQRILKRLHMVFEGLVNHTPVAALPLLRLRAAGFGPGWGGPLRLQP